MTDPEDVLGVELPSFTAVAERGQLQLFAAVTGQRDPMYADVDAVRAQGYPDLLIPPTFLFSLELRRPDRHEVLRRLGADLTQVLHGEQTFDYARLAFAGESLHFAPDRGLLREERGGRCGSWSAKRP